MTILCLFQLGLPLSCLCTVPCTVTHMELNVLQKLIEDDISSGKTPTIVIAYAGNCLYVLRQSALLSCQLDDIALWSVLVGLTKYQLYMLDVSLDWLSTPLKAVNNYLAIQRSVWCDIKFAVFFFVVCLYGWGYVNAGWCDRHEILAPGRANTRDGTGTR